MSTPNTHRRLPTVTSGVCQCGAVYDYGNVAVPSEYRGLCGRCAVRHGMRLGSSGGVGATRSAPREPGAA